jgi:predicted dehydrogenase
MPGDVTRRSFVQQIGMGMVAAAVPATQLAPPDKQPPNLHVPDGKPKKLGWAIVGLGELAINEILPAFAKCEHAQVTALVSGHPDKAKKLAAFYGLDPAKSVYSYDNYDTLADNPAVDVIYIVLPNHMHAEYTIRGLKNAKKHVFCEKPMCVNVAEARYMVQAAKESGKQLGIAYRLQYEPFNQKVRQFAQEKIGKVQFVEAQNAQRTRAPNIRLSKETAGGPLGDVGVYCLQATIMATGEIPTEFSAMQHQPADNPDFAEVPATVTWISKFPSGAIAQCTASFNSGRSNQWRVVGDKGYVNLEPAFAYQGQQLTLVEGQSETKFQMSPVDHFATEMDAFSQSLMENKPNRVPGEMGLRDMILVEAIQKAIDTGERVKVENMDAFPKY